MPEIPVSERHRLSRLRCGAARWKDGSNSLSMFAQLHTCKCSCPGLVQLWLFLHLNVKWKFPPPPKLCSECLRTPSFERFCPENEKVVVDENVSLKPYLEEAKNAENSFEAQLEKMGFEVAEEQPARKIGFTNFMCIINTLIIMKIFDN